MEDAKKKQQEAKQIKELANKMAMLKLKADQQAQIKVQQKTSQ